MMAKPNFSFQKRQKEIAKQKKNEEKRLRKLDKSKTPNEETTGQPNPEEDATKE
jgi:hypothetical protein